MEAFQKATEDLKLDSYHCQIRQHTTTHNINLTKASPWNLKVSDTDLGSGARSQSWLRCGWPA